MDFNKLFIILILSIFTILLNLPFGYFRKKTKRYSFRWFLYIHIPIPLIFFARVIANIQIKYVPIFVVSAIIGQVLGSKIEL
ncbi:MAG: hypothetical protein ACPL1G_10470 [Thermodesulfovibrionales bacterium]